MEILEASELFLTPANAAAAVEAARTYLECYAHLMGQSLVQMKPLYKCRPKLHHFHHKIVQRTAWPKMISELYSN